MAKQYRDTGITFKQIDINEADRIISVLTKYHGRVDAVAKGVRKIASRKGGNIDIMNKTKFSFANGKELDIVLEAELIDSYQHLKQKLSSTSILFYICELLDKFLQTGSRERETYDLTDLLLEVLKKYKSNLPLAAFELKIMAIQGYEPSLETCIKCNKPLGESQSFNLSPNSTGLLCAEENSHKGMAISAKTLKVIKFLLKNNLKDSIRIKTDKELLFQIKQVTKQWLEVVLDKELKSTKFLNTDN